MSKKYHREGLREQFIQKAKEIYLNESLEAITVRRVSKELDVSPMAFYHYFSDLLVFRKELAASYINELEMISRSVLSSDLIGYKRLYKLGEAYVYFALEHPKQFILMFQPGYNLLVDVDWSTIPLYRVLVETIIQILPKTSTPVQIQNASLSTWSLVHGLAFLLIDGPFKDLKNRPEVLKNIIPEVLKNIKFE